MKKLTMEEIAKHFNISKSLVSLALSDKYGVSEEMRSRIMLYAMENGYDFEKRRKNGNSAKNIAMIIRDDLMMTEAFWSKIIIGVEQSLNIYKASMNIIISSRFRSKDDLARQIAANRTSGIILIGMSATAEMVEELKRLNLPLVLVDSYGYKGNDLDRIETDNYYGGYNAAEYLYSLGHRKLCFIGDPQYTNSFKQRYNGFRDFCETVTDITVLYLTGRADRPELPCYNHESLLRFLSEQKEHIAILCANDPIAFQVYDLCNIFGKKIGKDISVLGFDNVETCLYLSPPLSSVHVPKTDLGRNAAAAIVQRLAEPDKPFEVIQLSTRIVARRSVCDLTAMHQTAHTSADAEEK